MKLHIFGLTHRCSVYFVFIKFTIYTDVYVYMYIHLYVYVCIHISPDAADFRLA